MLRVDEVRMRPGFTEEALRKKTAARLFVDPAEIRSVTILRRSIDARKKPELFISCSVLCEIHDAVRLPSRLPHGVSRYTPQTYRFPFAAKKAPRKRPVIIGAGPAGLFCALVLSEAGYAPILLERGEMASDRAKTVERFWETGVLDPSSNALFGEGGAGTFSDGKLNSLIRDKEGLGRFVLSQFVRFGADPAILIDQHPHLGTDRLLTILTEMRKTIEHAGGTYAFRMRADGLSVRDGALCGIYANDRFYETDAAVFAIGHSARDTFRMLYENGVRMEEKAFAMGLRIRHPQAMIDNAQYGALRDDLPPAVYKLTHRSESGRGVYTFCMCPGGYVVNASSETDGVVVNGMSYAKRDGAFANAAVIAQIAPADFSLFGIPDGPAEFGGICVQRMVETAAARLCEGRIPAMSFGRYREDTAFFPEAMPSFADSVRGACGSGDLRTLYPEAVTGALREGILSFGKKIAGFDADSVMLFGPETRTSSPVRILRDENGEASIRGLFPCGEGAGYAGGILSAAVDGIRTAVRVANGVKILSVE